MTVFPLVVTLPLTLLMGLAGALYGSRLQPPALLFVDFGTEKLGHVVTFMGTQEDRAEIWNPLGGKSLMTTEALARTWHGHAFEVRKDGP